MKAWKSNLAPMGYTGSDPTGNQLGIKKSYQLLFVPAINVGTVVPTMLVRTAGNLAYFTANLKNTEHA